MCPPRPRRACARWRAYARAAMLAVGLACAAPALAGEETLGASVVAGRPNALVFRLGGEGTDRLPRPVLLDALAPVPRTARLIFAPELREGALLNAGPRHASPFVLGFDVGVSYLRALINGDSCSWLSPFFGLSKSTLGLRLRF
jgi:hypothetical protein